VHSEETRLRFPASLSIGTAAQLAGFWRSTRGHFKGSFDQAAAEVLSVEVPHAIASPQWSQASCD
jgi:hypothetical protein